MANTLKLINDRARKLKAKNKNLSHIDAISKASKELKREGKIGTGTKKAGPARRPAGSRAKIVPRKKKARKPYQTGTSNKAADKLRKALPPGRRVAKKSKRVYTETRANRTDMPGRLTGISGSLVTMRDRLERDIVAVTAKINQIKAEKGYPPVLKASYLKRYRNVLASHIKALNNTNRLIRQNIK